MIKRIALAIVIGPPIVVAIIIIVQKGGPNLAISLGIYAYRVSRDDDYLCSSHCPSCQQVYCFRFQMETLEPKFRILLRLKFPLKKLFVVDGSTRFSHSNAYMYDFSRTSGSSFMIH